MKKIKIDQEKCIGCGLCPSIAEEVFKLGEDGKAETIEGYEGIGGVEGKIKEAIDSCPVQAIKSEDEG